MFRLYTRMVVIFLVAIFISSGVSAQDSLISSDQKESNFPKRKSKPIMEEAVSKPRYVHPAYSLDADGDGVPNGRDKCPETPKGIQVTPFGCPMDADFDMIFDYEDHCPQVPGPRANNGCPWGDTDKDGVYDDRDKCVEVPGLRRYNGCPDTDGDGIPDSEDFCPDVPGVREFRGCPPIKKDTDKDQLFDDDDLCPEVFGSKTNKGCPDIDPDDKQVVEMAFENLLFEFDKDEIQQISYDYLNKLGVIMQQNAHYLLMVEGHCDRMGNDEYNLSLSTNRADAVKDYLIQWGISPLRIRTFGYGKTRPIANNHSEKGRKLNRRVEMTLNLEKK
ncbi:MAG: OmpA family protein [Verrucomicrobia bacterium]|nr:OmpA family protein [Cytophagales bacterium]